MKTGKSLSELAQEIQRQQETKKDYIADTRKIHMTCSTPDNSPQLDIEGVDSLQKITDNCHAQFADRLKIPKGYYDRMRNDYPELLVDNVNGWLKKNPAKRLVRTLDGNARAFLSDRYRPLDNFDFLENTLPILSDNGCDIVSCEVTDNRLFVKALIPKVEGEIEKGDIVQSGIVLSNSEVGAGSLRVEPLIYRLACLNGMIAESALKKYHLGKSNGNGDDDKIYQLLHDDTKAQTDKALWMQVRDIVESAFKVDIFNAYLEKLRSATLDKIGADPIKVIEKVKKTYSLSDGEKTSILTHLIQGGSLTRYGLANAITRTANDLDDYHRATEFERLGGKIIELPKSDYQVLTCN